MIRPLLPEDVPAARAVQWAAMAGLNDRLGVDSPEQTADTERRGQLRIAHLQHTDPDGAVVAEVDGEVVGCGLALVRDGMWFLSLLMVDPAFQGRGIGRELLDATVATSTDRSWILATEDPAALRRYQRAGFDLHATFTAKGAVDRSLLPAIDVQESGWDEGADLVDHVSRAVRGATLVRDVPFLEGIGARLLVVPGQGYLVLREGMLVTLAATDVGAARSLLWAALAEGAAAAEVDWLGHGQQWAIDVCLDARLSLKAGATICLRGQPPMPLYIPGGALG